MNNNSWKTVQTELILQQQNTYERELSDESIKLARYAVQKQINMPIIVGTKVCPFCDSKFKGRSTPTYCEECGQALWWT